jgi:hypothetical protein
MEEKPEKKNQGDGARARQWFAQSGSRYGDLIDERSKWEARLRSWRQSRFWLPLWGPKPTEPGCFAPLEVLQQGTWPARRASKRSSWRLARSYLLRERTAHRKAMPATKHRRRGKARPRHQMLHLAMPPRHRITEQDHRDDALLDDRLHQLFGLPATIHRGGGIDWSWEQYSEAVAQLEAEGMIRLAREVASWSTDSTLSPHRTPPLDGTAAGSR